MKSALSKKRKAWGLLIVSFWLAVGVAVPLYLHFHGDELQFENAVVVAEPRDSFQITDTLLIDAVTGTTISGGRLGMAVPEERELTAEKSAALLKRGEAVLLLDGAELAIGTSYRTNEDTTAAAPLVQVLQAGTYQALTLRQSTLVVVLPSGHRERLTRADVHVLPMGRGSFEAKGQGFWRGQRTKFSIAANPSSDAGDVQFKMKLQASLMDFSYDGKINVFGRSAGLGALSLHLKDTERLANALGTSWPFGTSVQDVRLSGPMRWEASTIAFDAARVGIGDNDGQGTVSLNMAGGQAMISSTLAFDQLDIAPYLPSAASDHRSLAWQWWTKIVTTLSQPDAQHVNADMRLSTKALMANDVPLGPAAATVSLKNGKLSADVAEIAIGAGRATGQVAIDFNRYLPKVTVRGRIEDIPSEAWTASLVGQRFVSGKGRLVAELASQGAGLSQLLSDLAGSIEFSLPEGGSIDFSVPELHAAQSGAATIDISKLIKRALLKPTAVTKLGAVFAIKDGVAKVVSASATHATGLVKLGGLYDLNRRSYHLRVLSVKGTPPKSADTEPATTTVAAGVQGPRSPTFEGMLLSFKTQQMNNRRSDWSLVDGVDGLGVQLRAVRGSGRDVDRALGENFYDGPRQGL